MAETVGDIPSHVHRIGCYGTGWSGLRHTHSSETLFLLVGILLRDFSLLGRVRLVFREGCKVAIDPPFRRVGVLKSVLVFYEVVTLGSFWLIHYVHIRSVNLFLCVEYPGTKCGRLEWMLVVISSLLLELFLYRCTYTLSNFLALSYGSSMCLTYLKRLRSMVEVVLHIIFLG